MSFGFRITAQEPTGPARCGVLDTPHGPVTTPAFMPVGTRGTVKGILPRDLSASGSSMILANTLHMHLRPGEATVRDLGGLHKLMAWDAPILTDSGGYQVFSMADISSLDDDGVTFRSIVDGSRIRFTPEFAMDVQRDLGADVIMAFDHCPAEPTDRAAVQAATDRTQRWLDRCVARWKENGGLDRGQALFGIVQGGAFADLRAASVSATCAHDLVGYAVGGVSVGEDRDAIHAAFEAAIPLLPVDKPRYLMGIGTPLDFFEAISRGADLFDCVTPTRHGRNHQAFTSLGRVNVRNAGWKERNDSLDPNCPCPACSEFPIGALRHLCVCDEMLGASLLSLHNIYAFHSLMEKIRAAIAAGTLAELRANLLPLMEQRRKP